MARTKICDLPKEEQDVEGFGFSRLGGPLTLQKVSSQASWTSLGGSTALVNQFGSKTLAISNYFSGLNKTGVLAG
ncbi:MAG: hypothetical protein HY720_16055 [Planctomycetes bacterium]|nr:hypothetical protein [Planctomycetota bacterium]